MKVIYKLRTGSHLYGLNTPESDEDFGGIFIPTIKQLLGTHPIKEVDLSTKKSSEKRQNTSEDEDFKLYTLPQFLHLLTNNNPNIVEFLFPSEENIIIDSEVMQEIRDNADKFVSKKVWYSFSGYAFAQKKKLMTKRERFLNLRKGLEWIDNHKFLDPTDRHMELSQLEAEELNRMIKYYKGGKGNTNSFQKGFKVQMVYDKLKEEYDNYGWRMRTDSFEKLLYDCKFGYHLIRLLHEGRMLLETGKLEYPISGKVYADIMAVRNAEVSYEDLLTMYEEYYKLCEEAYKKTIIREKPDFKWIEDFQIRTLLNAIKEEDSGKR